MLPPSRTALSDRAPPALLAALALFLAASFGLRVWYGSVELHPGRVWDERFEVDNVAALLDGSRPDAAAPDRPWPANVFYPSLSYLPHAAVLGAARGGCRLVRSLGAPCALDVLRPDGGFTATGYLLARSTEALFGALSLLWLYRVGRRLFDPAVALAGVAVLAAVPWHLRMSAVFKPDVVMLFCVLVAVEAALRVAEHPTPGRHLWAGAAVGLAVAAKYNALAAAVPLAVGSLADLRRRPRRLLLLAPLAALAALAVFFLLNPFLLTAPELFDRDFGRTLEDYERKGEAAQIGRLRLPLAVAGSLLSGRFHGAVLGTAAIAALAILALRVLRDRRMGRRRREELSMFLSFPVGYLLLYLAVTTNPAEHNWLPLTPFTSLAAGWLLVAAWRTVAGTRWMRVADRGGLALLLAASLALGASYTYAVTVPATWVRAAGQLRAALDLDFRGRAVLYDLPRDIHPVIKHGQRNKVAMVPRGELDTAAAARLARTADARIHLARRAPGPGCLPGGTRPRVQRFAASPFDAWGESVVLYLQPWRRAGRSPMVATEAGSYLPSGAGTPGAWLSVLVVTAPGVEPLGLERVTVAGRPARTLWAGVLPGGRHQFVSERVPAPASGEREVRLPDAAPGVVAEVALLTWLPPASGEPCAAASGGAAPDE